MEEDVTYSTTDSSSGSMAISILDSSIGAAAGVSIVMSMLA